MREKGEVAGESRHAMNRHKCVKGALDGNKNSVFYVVPCRNGWNSSHYTNMVLQKYTFESILMHNSNPPSPKCQRNTLDELRVGNSGCYFSTGSIPF